MKRPLIAAFALLGACIPPPGPVEPAPQSSPAPGAWVSLAGHDAGARRVSYAPGSIRPATDGSLEALARFDFAAEQEFEGARYTQQEMRVRVRCGPPLTMITTVSDSLRLAGAVVAGHTYGATVWAPVGESAPADERWPLALCGAIAAVPGDTVPPGLAAARAGYVAAWNGTDRAALAAFFAEDARVIFRDYTLAGRAQIEERWLAEDVGKVRDLKMVPERVTRAGDELTESGTATLRFRRGDGSMGSETGRYEHVWARQDDGTWKLRSVRMDTHPTAS